MLPDVVFPSGFTPNGDGYNEYWQIDFVDKFPQMEVEIYNRWGEMLFESVGYGTPWDGKYKGKPLTPDVYVYVVEVQCGNNEVFGLKGNVTLLR